MCAVGARARVCMCVVYLARAHTQLLGHSVSLVGACLLSLAHRVAAHSEALCAAWLLGTL